MKNLVLLAVLILLVSLLVFNPKNYNKFIPNTDIKTKTNLWEITSIDTMKFSRDLAKTEKNKASFDSVIDDQVKNIAETGASHIGIGTPYDKEFVPFLARWVTAARKYNLHVWFRGNFAGWEGWFDYPKIDKTKHKELLKEFILTNPDLFEDGDIFTSCTECENGGPGDPRNTDDIEGHREFLIDEHHISQSAFAQIGKDVETGYFPMNADVAWLVMDQATTKSLGGVVVIDHYVTDPDELNNGVNELAKSSGGHVVLGEFGTPILEINGHLTDGEQADWIKKALTLLANNKYLIGVNYWTSVGGSTRLWLDNGIETPASKVVTSFYTPKSLTGVIKNEAGDPIVGALLTDPERSVTTDKYGYFSIPFLANEIEVTVSAPGYYPSAVTNIQDNQPITTFLKMKSESVWFKLRKFLYQNIYI